MNMELDINDLNEIERNYDGLAGWLTNHFASFSACAFVLQTVMNAVDEAKEQLNDSK